jgi:hypothetical protein
MPPTPEDYGYQDPVTSHAARVQAAEIATMLVRAEYERTVLEDARRWLSPRQQARLIRDQGLWRA